jgi:hypothetical protein
VTHSDTVGRSTGHAKRTPWAAKLASLGSLVLVLPLVTPTAARAVDGCLVLLCFAAPSWRAIPECVPPIRQVLHDLSRGKPFPSCGMAGAGNSASHAWAAAPHLCPPQYTHLVNGEGGPFYLCDYIGAVTVLISGGLFTRTWWSTTGETVTEFSAEAKAQLGTWETRFDDDYAAWLALQPPPPVPGE